MKDIKYNSDLSEDIYNLNNNNVSHISLLSSQYLILLLQMLISALIFNIFSIPTNIISIISFVVGNIVFNFASAFIIKARMKDKLNKINRRSNSNINNLINTLANNGLSTSKEKLIDCTICEELTSSRTTNEDNEVINTEDKIIRYFYLLDNNDKIRVLKQIKREIISNKTKINSNSLSLLEDKDLEGKELPVRKTLVLKEKKR